MSTSLYLTLKGDTQEELNNALKAEYLTRFPTSNSSTNVKDSILQDIQIKLSSLNSKYNDVIANYEQNKESIDQLLTEAHDLAMHQNELTADKMNKKIEVVKKLFQFIRVAVPANTDKSTPILPNAFNVVNLWTNDQVVNMAPVNNDSHLYFLFAYGKMHALPISAYNNNSDPQRLSPMTIQVGKGDNVATFEVLGENANLVMKTHFNPDDAPSMELIKFF